MTSRYLRALMSCAATAFAQDLYNRAFQVKYDATGIHSLKRTADVQEAT